MEDSQRKTDSGAPLYENLRKVVNLIDELRDIGLQQHISLPRIAVLGTQSAGKSSLLESIVGMDFLPRGDGVVTRRPLELRLVHVPHGQNDKPYGIFEKYKDKKFYNFDEIRDMINKLTDELCGVSKGIVDNPIVLTVYSYSCPDLTLVDLPGITRIAIAGQDKNIEQVTKEMAKRYCGDPRTIILAVMPANQDMSTSDALQMAMELDPKGTRTLGVITKIDIMDRGTNAKKMVMGEEISLRLGYVGVKGRSKHDIDHKVTVKKGLDDEKQYFASHPVYSTMPPGYLGIETLTQKLTKILFHHIRNYLPEILKEINSKIKDCEDRLKDLGTSLPISTKDKVQLLWQLITKFTENYKNALSGRYDAKLEAVIELDISGAAHIKAMFSELYGNYVSTDYKATEDYTDRDIDKAIIMHEGDSIPGFPSIDAFLYLLQPQLDKLKEPATGLISFVYGYMEELAVNIMSKLFHRFPDILEVMQDIVLKAMQEHREKTRKIVEQVIDAESSFLYTTDTDYLIKRGAFIQKTDNRERNTVQDPNKVLANELRYRIDSYFNLVCRNVRDSVPKIIGTFLVRACQDELKFTLYDAINKHDELMTLLSEPESITMERQALQKTLDTLNKAMRAIKKDPDLNKRIGIDEKEEPREKPQSRPNPGAGAGAGGQRPGPGGPVPNKRP
jgi:GTP-binding protein EngB required for normal cell division